MNAHSDGYWPVLRRLHGAVSDARAVSDIGKVELPGDCRRRYSCTSSTSVECGYDVRLYTTDLRAHGRKAGDHPSTSGCTKATDLAA